MNKIICCLQGYFHPEYFSPFFTCHILEFTQTHLCSKEVVCNICFHLILNFSLTMRAKGIKIRRGEYFSVNNIHIYIYIINKRPTGSYSHRSTIAHRLTCQRVSFMHFHFALKSKPESEIPLTYPAFIISRYLKNIHS